MKFFKLLFLLITVHLFSQNVKKNELLIPFREGNSWGLCDTLGVIKVKPFIANFEDFAIGSDFMGQYIIKNKGKFSIVNQYKKVLLPNTDLDSLRISNFSNEILIYKNNKVGLLKDFKIFIPIEYDHISSVANGSFNVTKDHKQGLINSKGKLIIPVEYSFIGWPKKENVNKEKMDWIAFYGNNEEMIYTDDKILVEEKLNPAQGTLVYRPGDSREKYEEKQSNYRKIESIYGKIVSILDDMVVTKNENKYSVYSIAKGKIILENDDIIDIFPPNHGYYTFSVKRNNKLGMIDETGKVLLDSVYDKIEYKLNGICFIEKDNKFGMFILNSAYNPIEPKYKKIEILEAIPINSHWQFGIFKVTLPNDKIGFLGENGIEYFKN